MIEIYIFYIILVRVLDSARGKVNFHYGIPVRAAMSVFYAAQHAILRSTAQHP